MNRACNGDLIDAHRARVGPLASGEWLSKLGGYGHIARKESSGQLAIAGLCD